MNTFRRFLRRFGLTRPSLRGLLFKPVYSPWMLKLHLSPKQRTRLFRMPDPIRYGTILLALEEIRKSNIAGSFAEGGVYEGVTSKFLHEHAPDRRLYLFDTFEGFDGRDSLVGNDGRFKDTSVEMVLKSIGDTRNVTVRKGYFPQTAVGLEHERFAFVMIDFDKYEPTKAALEFFYERMTPGGYIFIHDVNSPESDWACSRALREFLLDKPEKLISIPDAYGSAVFRKV